ncbi:MAG: PhzF family phenazine biosynthesis protein [Breznakibacter sp.]
MKLLQLLKRVYQVDAFTTLPFKGNPAGVVVLDDLSDVGFMQKMAAEMNLSETAFLSDNNGEFHIRFFTPYSEIPLCGHATLASAHVLYENKIAGADEPIVFKSTKHQLAIHYGKNGIHMQFPTYKTQSVDTKKEFCDITGLNEPTHLYKTEHGWFMAHYADVVDVKRAHPHLQHMKHSDFGHLIITAKGSKNEDCDYILRCFVPALGIDEDPVTGSAQCVLAPYWAGHLHKTDMVAYQASSRGGLMHVKIIDDGRIEISGKAVTIFEGNLKV